ncbi:MAG TPA: PhoH family protein [Bacteroidetes bacterium]|nr:PhoH family protein [Bacteroidota bacterium]
MEKTSEILLKLTGVDPLEFYGIHDSKINILKSAFPDLNITMRGDLLKLSGNKKDAQKAKAKIELMLRIIREHDELPEQSVRELVGGDNPVEGKIPNGKSGKAIVHGRDGRPVKAKTKNQKKLVESSEINDIVFAIGPAGTGKTYTAVALAVRALRNRLVKKIILTRPAVEAGENLGFLPGDMKDKVDPYLRPLYDALDDMIHPERLKQFVANRVIEVAPLAFMRGRTLDNAFVILDEAQNATSVQIKMFLTRLGPNAKCIVTGDLTQIDLPRHQYSGLAKALDILRSIEGIGEVRMSKEDVVRHRLVKKIIHAYDSEIKKEEE